VARNGRSCGDETYYVILRPYLPLGYVCQCRLDSSTFTSSFAPVLTLRSHISETFPPDRAADRPILHDHACLIASQHHQFIIKFWLKLISSHLSRATRSTLAGARSLIARCDLVINDCLLCATGPQRHQLGLACARRRYLAFRCFWYSGARNLPRTEDHILLHTAQTYHEPHSSALHLRHWDGV